jgi:IS30 family transposase
MHYRQFTYTERRCIAEILEREPKTSKAEIARRLGRSKSAVCEEILHNRQGDGTYLACVAAENARARKHRLRGPYKRNRPGIVRAVKDGLRKRWSPKIGAAKRREEHPDDPGEQVSHQTIYTWIRGDKAAGGRWFKSLPQGNRKRRKRYGRANKRGLIPNRVGIEQRPAIVEEKARVGDWEGDTVAGRKGGGGLASFVERKTQYVVLDLLRDGAPEELNRGARRGFRRHGSLPTETLTLDNGREFMKHESLAKSLGVDVYFARPYHAWERGLNEQVNGMVRWWFPKGTDFRQVSPAEVRRVEKLLNDRPRELLGYRTPAEAMRHAVVRLQI